MVPEAVQLVWALEILFIGIGLPVLYLVVTGLDDWNRRKTREEYRRQMEIMDKWTQAKCKDSC